MIISEVIKELEEIKEKEGDITVAFYDLEYGDYVRVDYIVTRDDDMTLGDKYVGIH